MKFLLKTLLKTDCRANGGELLGDEVRALSVSRKSGIPKLYIQCVKNCMSRDGHCLFHDDDGLG